MRRVLRVSGARVVGALRDATSQLRRESLYAATMIATLTIGIAAAAAIFSVVRGVVLRPLPYENADAIVTLQEYQPTQHRNQTGVASANLSRLQRTRSLVAVSGFNYSEYVLSDDRDAERVIGAGVDADVFSVLGVRPALGRAIATAEVGPNPAHIVIVSDAIWHKRFNGDRRALGKSITIDGTRYTLIGVMPPAFEFPRNPSMSRDVDIWVPRRSASPMMMRRGMRDLTVIARLKQGILLRDAQLELTTVANRAAEDDARLNMGWQLRAVGLRDMMVGTVRPVLLMLAICVGVLLLIACANASAGALARITMRRQTIGVRLALGATRGRMAELLISETMLLAILSAIVALPVSSVIRDVLVGIAPVAIPRQSGIAVDGWTIGFAGLVAMVAALLTSIGPVIWLNGFDLTAFMSDAGRSATGSRARNHTLRGFVVTQLALATVLLAATARLYIDYSRINRVDPGFIASDVTSATIALGGMRYRDPHTRSMLTVQLLARVRALPGVDRATMTSLLPMSGGLMSSGYTIPGLPTDSSSSAAVRAVSSDFFATLGIPIRQGRSIRETDEDGAAAIAVVNEAFVRQSLGGVSAVGRSLVITPPGGDSARTFQIVGVAGDAKERDLLAPSSPIIYFSDKQASFPHVVLALRTHGSPPMAAVRTALRELDPSLALDDVGELTARVRSSYSLQFFLLTILAVFAISGALLIGVGVYGSVSLTTAAEMRATGVRMALGATRIHIVVMLFRRIGLLALVGCSFGVAAAIALPRLLGETAIFAFGVGVEASMAGAAAVLLVAIGATAIPAIRASGSDPIAVLRES